MYDTHANVSYKQLYRLVFNLSLPQPYKGGIISPTPSSSSFFFFNTFWPHSAAFGILVPGPGIEPEPAAMEARSPNHWTSREVPSPTFKRGN